MAKLADILSIERDRQEPEKWNVIHLFKTGSFYTAYEWSAWLTAVVSFNDEVRKQTKSRMPLTVTRNEIASSENETFCKVGFPMKSVEKFIPERTGFEAIDDSNMVDPDREWLLAQVPKVREFLADELGLQLHMGKLHIRDVRHGVEFLGAFVKPYRDYVSNKTLNRIVSKMQEIDIHDSKRVSSTVNSYLGILSHTASFNLRQELFGGDDLARIIEIDTDYCKSKPKTRFCA